MENKIDTNKETIEKAENKSNENKITWHQIIWYMLIFSVCGLIMENIFAYMTTGVLESRKGLILGPFCPIYGVGAIILILALNKYRGHKIKLFLYGGILGDFVEYVLSFGMEAMYGSRFWNYENAFNLNGRICILYTAFWGILAILLIDVIKGIIDKLIAKIDGKPAKIIDIIVTVFFIFDIILTIWATSVYKARAKEVYYKVKVFNEPSILRKIGDKIFTDNVMVKIFPNLRFIDDSGNEIWIRDVINSK